MKAFKKVLLSVIVIMMSMLLLGCSNNIIEEIDEEEYTLTTNSGTYSTQPSTEWRFFDGKLKETKIGTAKYHGMRFDLYSYKNDEKHYIIIAKHHEFLGISGMASREFQFYNNNIEFPQIDEIDNVQMYYVNLYTSNNNYQSVSNIIYDSDTVETIKDLVKSNGKITINREEIVEDNYYIVMRSSSIEDYYAILRKVIKLNNNKYYIKTINGEDEYAEMPTELFLQLTGNADNSAGTDS